MARAGCQTRRPQWYDKCDWIWGYTADTGVMEDLEMVKITKIRSWNLNADNLDETVRFYQQALGAKVERENTVAGARVTRLSLGDTGLGIFDASEGARPGVPHHTFELQDAGPSEELVRDLESKGITVENTRQHGEGAGYSVYITDPCGNRLELSYDPA